MKKLSILFLAALFVSCQQSDIAPQNPVAWYLSNQPVLINLEQFNTIGSGATFSIATPPKNGTASILNDRFLLYTPAGASQDSIGITVAGENGEKSIGLKLAQDSAACGLAVFDKRTIQKGESLSFNLLENDKLCGAIVSTSFAVIYLDKTSGYFELANSHTSTGYSTLKFTPSPTFTGTARILYAAGINMKEFKPLSAEEMVRNPRIFQYFISGIAEVEVQE